MEAVSTCTFTAGVEEDAERFHAKCAAVVLKKYLSGVCDLEPSLHRASVLDLISASLLWGRMGWTCLPKKVRLQHLFRVCVSDCLGFG